MNINETVLKTLEDSKEPLKAGEIAEIAGVDKKEVDKAIKALKKEGKIASPKRCYYDLNK
ncbi:HTH domain-containing protein [Desulfoscipio gibsoniae]|uniref:HTH domain-containing protein n=1 Tax=Desulfoscipio gibsoniae DSM 7213 TaxID=767817 RepID=R4KMF7_9FIRM|nr:HTH domain-containing protein [Desulfoscipio gibsoniae]AGL02742.1 HTH domain-containing protein [Desulfoscipio gibsoniae DSM 7213]